MSAAEGSVAGGRASPPRFVGNKLGPPIRCIVLSKFDVTLGPKVVVQAPEGVLSKAQFDPIKKYLIPKPELCNRLVTVNTPEHHILGHPVDIEANHYPRNHLIFNVALVFDTNAEASMFEPLLRKLVRYFRALEEENGFMLHGDDGYFQQMLSQIRSEINTGGIATVPVNDATTITLSVMNIPPRRRGSEADQMLDNKDMPGLRRQTTTATAAAAAEMSGGHAGRAAGVQHQLPAAHAHLVPILLQPAARVPLSDLDWTVTAVLPSIDGVRFMADVAINSGVELAIAAKAVESLIACGCA
eukprot:gene15876-461_t